MQWKKLIVILLILPAVSASSVDVSGSVDILNYVLDVQVFPERHSFAASALITVKLNSVDIPMKLNELLRVENVTANGKQLKFKRNGSELELFFDEPMQSSVAEIKVDFSGRVEMQNRNSGELRWGYIGEDASYMIYESAWYPVIFGDRTSARISIKVPRGYSAITVGELIGVEEAGDYSKFIFDAPIPIAGISFVVGKYKQKTDVFAAKSEFKLVEVACYLQERDFYLADECLKMSKKILGVYSKMFSGYPYPKFAVVEMPEFFFGGHGDQGFIMVQSNILRERSYEFLAHEVAHNWWGALITADGSNLRPFFGIKKFTSASDKTENVWLHEGFATYSALMFLEREYGREKMIESLKSKRKEYLQFAQSVPISKAEENYGIAEYHAVVYSKGAFVLHMLRYVVGEENFAKIIDTYIKNYRHKSATIEDFQKICENIAGISLDWFFEGWIKSTALPDYEVSSVKAASRKNSYATKVKILQKGGVIKMPLDITLRTSDGEITKKIWMEREKEVEFITTSKPELVSIDKNYWILESDKSNNIYIIDRLSFTGVVTLFKRLFMLGAK